MAQFGMSHCRAAMLAVCLGFSLGLAGCTTIQKTFDTTPDPEMQRPGIYPNINESGAKQPGKLLTPAEQASTTASIAAKGAQASPALGAAAKAQGDAAAVELDKIARTHASNTLTDIKNGCTNQDSADATKCPQ